MALTITSTSPATGATDVVLGLPITITFNSLINTTTLNNASFSLTCPGGTEAVTPGSLITQVPKALSMSQFVSGTFSFNNSLGYTIATFTPSVPLIPNTIYTALIVGSSAAIAGQSAVKDTNGNPLASTYMWTFTTSDLNVTTPPLQSPLAGPVTTYIDLEDIQISPLKPLVNQNIDSGYIMTITFPAAIDPTSLNISDIVASIEPILNDPTVTLSANLGVSVSINSTNPAQLQVIIGTASGNTLQVPEFIPNYITEKPTGAYPGTVYTLSHIPAANNLVALFLNAGFVDPSQYTVSGTRITLQFTTNPNDSLLAVYFY